MKFREHGVTRSSPVLRAVALFPFAAALLFSGCATPRTFHGITISPTDCRDGNGVHVACPIDGWAAAR